ncbi:MAG TPA: DUF362 domain-containing protein [bacterium]|nr:DUF362 domain-containing protein [bacterium]
MKEQVVVVKCASYENGDVKTAVDRIFSISGIRKDSPGKMLFKPNMLSARLPEEGVTTHPSVLEKTLSFFDSREKLIGDSPANSLKPIHLYWERCGYLKVSENTGSKLVKFGSSFFVDVDCGSEIVRVPVTSLIKDYSLVNISKLKTHGLTVLTGAVKNLYGLIPGYHKSMLHSRFVSPLDFSGFIAAYYNSIKKYVTFNIVDAIVSMEGNGPSSGKLRTTGYLIGGKNAVAVDMVCCRLLGIKEETIPYLHIYKKKFGLPELEILGDRLTAVRNFSVPGKRLIFLMSNGFIKHFMRFAGKHFEIMPVIEPSKCVKCYACVQVCPVSAISKSLKFDREKCISCLCCFEVCPHRAIVVKKSLMARLFT